MQCLHADGSPCDDSQCLVVSQLSIPTLQVRFGVQNRSPTTLCTRSLLPSTHNSLCTPLDRLLGARRVDHWLRSTSHADRMQKSHAARSQSRHRTFVTKVNICAQRIILTVRFAYFPASATPTASQAALGVCVHDSTHAGVIFRFACTKS